MDCVRNLIPTTNICCAKNQSNIEKFCLIQADSILEKHKLAPRRYDKFLEHVIERRIMRRVGGSAVFIHRYILEYFAQEWTDKYASEFEV